MFCDLYEILVSAIGELHVFCHKFFLLKTKTKTAGDVKAKTLDFRYLIRWSLYIFSILFGFKNVLFLFS